jgi:hypothetical protein
MTIYYLMIKTHKITGLKYLCQTKQKNYKRYRGSGVDWSDHLKIHGSRHVTTEVVIQTTSKDELNLWGRHYSALYNVVGEQDDFGNKIWANKIIECGGGGGFNVETHDKIKKIHADMVANGTHNFQTRSDGTNLQTDRVADGTHHLLKREDGTSLASDRVKNGTLNLGAEFNKKMILEGKHASQNIEAIKKISDKAIERVENGTHNLLHQVNPNNTRVCCIHCKKETTLPVLSRSHKKCALNTS